MNVPFAKTKHKDSSPPAMSPDETEALLAGLYRRDPDRSYATTIVEGRVCLMIRPGGGDSFLLPLPAPYRGQYCTSVEDLLKVDLLGMPLTPDDQPQEIAAAAVHCAQLSSLEKVIDAAQTLIQMLCAYRCDAPHLMQATIHGVTLHWPRLDGGHVEITIATHGMAQYPATGHTMPDARDDEVVLMIVTTTRGQPAKFRTRVFEMTSIMDLAEELGLPKTPTLPERPA